MDKAKILAQLISDLENTLDVVKKAALQAKDDATNEESKAENEYDTRGLEASYLAGAQAKRADQLHAEIAQLHELSLRNFSESDEISNGALVTVDVDGDHEQLLFILPTAGGSKIELGSESIQVVTPSSPIGQLLMGQKVGSTFELKVGDKLKEYEILDLC